MRPAGMGQWVGRVCFASDWVVSEDEHVDIGRAATTLAGHFCPEDLAFVLKVPRG